MEEWSETTAHVRTISGIGARPTDLFRQEEQGCLRPLPESRWEEVFWTSAKVHETWRVQVDRAYYSVPYHLSGKNLLVFIAGTRVEIYDDYELVATHRKAKHPWQPVLDEAHNPPNVQEFLATTREGLLWAARTIGPHVETVVRLLFDRKATDGLRPARALVKLRSKFGLVRLDRACERALLFDNVEYGTIKRILDQQLDMKQCETPMDSSGNYCFQFSRPPGYFDSDFRILKEAL